MNISKKMLTIASNVPNVYKSGKDEGNTDGYEKGYNAGKSDGQIEGYDTGYSAGYNSGQSNGYESGKTDGYEDGHTVGYNEGYQNGQKTGYNTGYSDGYSAGNDAGYENGKSDGYEEGETAGYDKGYEEGQDNAPNPLEHVRAVSFTSTAFPDGYELELNMPVVESLASILVNATGIKKLTLKGNTNGTALDFNYAFASKTLEVIDATDFVLLPKTADYTFYNATSLREILGEWDMSNCTSATDVFKNCSALVEARFKPLSIPYMCYIQYSPLLSAETIQSIVEGLMSVGGVLKVHTDVEKYFTDELVAVILSQNWSVEFYE